MRQQKQILRHCATSNIGACATPHHVFKPKWAEQATLRLYQGRFWTNRVNFIFHNKTGHVSSMICMRARPRWSDMFMSGKIGPERRRRSFLTKADSERGSKGECGQKYRKNHKIDVVRPNCVSRNNGRATARQPRG